MSSSPASVADSWNPLSWVPLKNAASSRGLSPGTVQGLTPTLRLAHCAFVISQLVKWYSFDLTRPIPELLNREDMLTEAAAIGLQLTEDQIDHLPETDLKKLLVKTHIHLKADVDFVLADLSIVSGEEGSGAGSESSDSDDELIETDADPPPPFTGPLPGAAVIEDPSDVEPSLEDNGYPYCSGAGRAVFLFPLRDPSRPPNTRVKIPPSILRLFGTVITLHYVKQGQSEVTQDFRIITGLTHDSLPGYYSFEVLHLRDNSISSLPSSALAQMDRATDVSTAFHMAQDALGAPVSLDDSLDSSSADSHALIKVHKVIVTDKKLDLPSEFSKIHTLPRSLNAQGKPSLPGSTAQPAPSNISAPNTISANFADRADQDNIRRAGILRKHLQDGVAPVLAGLERKMEAYDQPKNQNLVTGEILDPRLSEADKLSELAHSYSLIETCQDVCCFCVCCTSGALEAARAADPSLDLSSSVVLQSLIVFGEPGAICCMVCPGKNGKGQPLHPNPFVPTVCYSCEKLVYFRGNIAFACPHCSFSYIMPAGGSHPALRRQSEADRELNDLHALENRVFQYLRLTGGPDSPFLGSAEDITQGRYRMGQQSQKFFQETRDYSLTPRHVLYGPAVQYSKTPNGLHGLCLRDFIPTRLRLYEMLQGAAGENPDAEFETWNSEAYGSATRLRTWVDDHMPFAPPWPRIDNSVVGESVIMRALENMGSFLVELGKRRAVDVELTKKALKLEMVGINADALPMIEHKAALTWYTFGSRIYEQASDFRYNRQWDFEKKAGPFIRLVYTQTLPLILQEIKLPLEQHMHSAAVSILYSTKFGGAGYLLSNETGSAPRKPRRKKNAGSGSASGGSPQFTNHLSAQMMKSSISLTAGLLVGERVPNTRSVLNTVPITDAGQRICANFQTCAGCVVGDLPCSLAHVKCLQFNPEAQRYFLARGGHSQWNSLSIDSLKPWLPAQFTSQHSELLTAQVSAVKHVDKMLERLSAGGSEKRAIQPVTQDGITRFATPITSSLSTPIPLWSTSGIRAKSVTQLTLGVGEAYFDGNSWDCGDSIELLNGFSLHNRCMIKALASQVRPPRVFLSAPGRSLEVELSIQVLECLLEIDISTLPLNSRAANIYVEVSQASKKGFDEALLDIVSPPLLAYSNVLLVSQGDITDPSARGRVGVRIWPAGMTMHTARETWRKPAEFASKFFTEWNWGHSAVCADLVGLASVFVSDSDSSNRKKHATGYDLPKKLHSWTHLTTLMARFTEFKQALMEVRVISKAALGTLRKEISVNVVSQKELVDARTAIRTELAFVLANSCPDSPYRLATLKKRASDLEKPKKGKNKPSDSTAAQGCTPDLSDIAGFGYDPYDDMIGPFLPSPTSVTSTEKDRRAGLRHPSPQDVACMAYMDLVRRLNSSIDRADPNSVEMALNQVKTATTHWFEIEKANTTVTDRDVTARQVDMLRYYAFGDRVSEGPAWNDIPSEIKGSLTEGHLAAMEELISRGHDSAWIGPTHGYAGDERPGLDAAALQVLSSMWDGIAAWKALAYDESLESELINKGLIIAPMDVVEKLDDRKQRRYDEKAKAYKLRCVTDHTDSGAKLALNSGTGSYRTTRQITTDNTTTAALAITEEFYNPNSYIGQEKCDYSGAFTIVQLISSRCKERAVKYRGIILCNLCLTFGGGDAPGAWDTVGSAASCSICVIPWPNPLHDGPTIPSHTKFVDDTHHFAAFRGDRQKRLAGGFKKLMHFWAGRDSLNQEKELESGGYTLRQHGFGKLVDTLKRTIATPLSRLCRTEDKLSRYLEDPKARFLSSEVAPARGSLNSILESAPGLGSLIFPRLDAMLSATAREYGSKRPPSDFQPSPALDGETREEAEAMLRLSLTVAWRFASLNDGEFLMSTYEQWLPFDSRITCPGKERPSQFLFPESDASGKAFLFFDPVTGVYIQEAYTKGEIDAMFDYGREDHGIIITNMEGLADTIGIPLTTFDHPDPVMVIPRNDNTGFVEGLNGNKSTNVKNLHCIMLLRIWSYLTGIDLHAIYVKTDDNLRADPGSRPEKEAEWQEELARWEAATGLKARRLLVPPALRDLSCWVEIPTALNLNKRIDDCFRKLMAILDLYESSGTSHRLRVPLATARSVLRECLDGAAVPKLDRTKQDFVEELGQSPTRSLIMSGPHHRTRITLMKLVARQPSALKKLRDEASASQTTCDQEVFNLIMQNQFDNQRQLLWQGSLSYTTPPVSTRLGSPVLHTPLKGVKSKVRFAELYAGRASLSRSCNDSGGGITVAVSEHNPRNWPELLHALPGVKLFESNEAMTLKALEQLNVEGVGGGSPCQAHSGGNPHAKGNHDLSAGGDEYERTGALMSKLYSGLGPAFHVYENSPGVKKKQPGGPRSPYEELLRATPGFTDAMHGKTLQASKTKSPLTDMTTPLNHERLFVILVNNACFPANVSLIESIPQSPTTLTAGSLLDHDSETTGRYVMPDQDVYGFKFNHSHGKASGLCMLGNISEPASGMGWGSFPNQVWDPHGGYAVTMTSGGARWMQTSFNSHPHFVHATNSEYARLYQFRHPPLDPGWLAPNSEFGMHVISHSIVQSVADAVMVSVMSLYTTPMSLSDSKLKGFDHCVTPQEVYQLLRRRTKPSSSLPVAGDGDNDSGDDQKPLATDSALYDWELGPPSPEITHPNETAEGYVQSDDGTASAGYSPDIPSSDSDQEEPIGVRFHGDQPAVAPVGRVITGVNAFRYSRVPLLSPEGAFHAGFQFPLSRNLTLSVDRTENTLDSDVCYRGAPSPYTGIRLPNVTYFDRGPDETAHQAARRRYRDTIAASAQLNCTAPTGQPNPHNEADIGAPAEGSQSLTLTCKDLKPTSFKKEFDPDDCDENELGSGLINQQHVSSQTQSSKRSQSTRQNDKKKQRQQALRALHHKEPPEPPFTTLVCLPQEVVASVCHQLISSSFHSFRNIHNVPPMLYTSMACISLLIEEGMHQDSGLQLAVMTRRYELDQATITQGNYSTLYEEEYFNIFGNTPAVASFLGHLARSLERDIDDDDIASIAISLHSYDPSLGIPMFGRLDWGEPSLIPDCVLANVGVSRSALQLFYPHLLIDAARNCRIYQHFRITQRVTRLHANLAGVSRKFYITFSPLVTALGNREADQLSTVHSILKRKIYDTRWHCPRAWHEFCYNLSNEENIWLAELTLTIITQTLHTTGSRDAEYDSVHNSLSKIPYGMPTNDRQPCARHFEFDRYTALHNFNLTPTTGVSAALYRKSDEAFWKAFNSEYDCLKSLSLWARLSSFTSAFLFDWTPPPLLQVAGWLHQKLSTSWSAAGSDMDENENRGRLTQVKIKRALSKKIVKSFFVGPVAPELLLERDGLPIQIATKNRRSRAMPVITDEMNSRIDEILIKDTNPKRSKVVHQQAQHYLDFCHASLLEPLIANPLDPVQQRPLVRFAGYERSEMKNKSDSIRVKFDAIDKLHTVNGLTAPSAHCDQLQSLLSKWKKIDAPSQPRIPVSQQVIELYMLENPMSTEDQRAKPASMAAGLEVCMRSCEYTMKDNGEYDPKALHWRDLFFRNDTELLRGAEVSNANRLTFSVSSNKNSLLRCTRTIFLTSSPVSAVGLLKQRYLDILQRTGTVPELNTPVFLLSTGKPISRREIASTIQIMLESLGVPSRFSGSHSLRRGGSCMYRAAGMPDADVARFGRWTSNAYKLYIHIESSALAEWSERAAQQMPRFELN